ncbi:helix-turn-helix domain-containing protein [Asanoa sp. NPDC049573]|uniref:helix-turn-helix domain-containing protein n=1 Tax=Asanoa sp. NPDC049573 TaxID=3155396 RepID=UPI00343C3ACE
MRDQARRWVEGLPRGLFADAVVAHALATRDFGVVFAAAKAAGMSFNAIAAATGMKAERVSLVARGAASVTALATVERIADGLRIPGAMVGLATRAWERDADAGNLRCRCECHCRRAA